MHNRSVFLGIVALCAATACLAPASRASALFYLPSGRCVLKVNGLDTDLDPHLPVVIGNRVFVCARALTYLGATYRLQDSAKLAITDAEGKDTVVRVRMINQRFGGTRIAYPYVPILETSRKLGWRAAQRVEWRPVWQNNRVTRRYKKVVVITLTKQLRATPGPPPTWDELFSQRASGEARFADGLSFKLRASIDSSRPRKERYVCLADATNLSNTGGRPVLSGNFAIFIEDAAGRVWGVESMQQSARNWPTGMVGPNGIRGEPGIGGLFSISPDVRLRRLIYSDGLRCFPVPFRATAR